MEVTSLFASYVVQATVLAFLVRAMNANTALSGATAGVLGWLGFASVILLQDSLFELRPLGLFGIKAGYEAVSLATMGVILGTWRKKTAGKQPA
ncbi:MAG TPA: DUF1761 domain-containing protein [Bacteroidota bacterium]